MVQSATNTETRKSYPCDSPDFNALSIARCSAYKEDESSASGNELHVDEEKVLANGNDASQIDQWPMKINFSPTNASYFDGANLLIAADCTAYAYANFHEDFIKGNVTLIGCPKLDECYYTERLAAIFNQNDIKSITVLKMEVPCCGGLKYAVIRALQNWGKMIPWQVVTISKDGQILE